MLPTFFLAALMAIAEVSAFNTHRAGARARHLDIRASKSKRGVAYNDAKKVAPVAAGNKMSWAYNWDSVDNGLSESLEFVPMLWGPIKVHTDRWEANVKSSLKKGAKCIFSFNEPDIESQANLDTKTALEKHIQYVVPYADKARISSPSVSNSNLKGEGVEWLTGFMNLCAKNAKCKVDFCAVHWYDIIQDNNVDAAVKKLKTHLEDSHKACKQKPIWLTEYAPKGNDKQIADFVKKSNEMMDKLKFLERYSYFKAEENMLLNPSGSLSSYGAVYAS